MTANQRILLVSHKSGMGGAERSLMEIAKTCRQFGYEVHILAPENGRLTQQLDRLNFDCHVIPFKHWVSPVFNPFKLIARRLYNRVQLRSVIDLIRRHGYDLVYTNTLTTPIGAIAAYQAGVPHIWHVREFGDRDHGYRFDRGQKTFTLMSEWSARIIANSFAVKKHLAGRIPVEKLEVIYNPVCTDGVSVREQVPDGPPEFLLPGAIQPGKRQEDAIKAFAKLAEESNNPKPQLTLIGGGVPSYRRKIERLARNSPASGQIKIKTFVDDADQLYESAFAVLMTSRCEAFGNVTVEALARGIPVIGSNCGGTTEIIEDHKSGLLFDPENPEDLYRKMKFALEHPDLMFEMGLEGSRSVRKKFASEPIRKKLIDLIKSVMNPRN